MSVIKRDERGMPEEIECDCGSIVFVTNSWANECEKCGREFNGCGQLLAPRCHWGEETGEQF